MTLFPLVIDLDGTLTPTDTLVESVIKLAKESPSKLLYIPFWLLKGRAAFKEGVATAAKFSVEQLPYREQLLSYLRAEKSKGRRIILATAAHKNIADAVSEHLDLFDEVIASDGLTNLKGEAKLKAIREKIGADFVYGGDSHADLPIWQAAQAAILVGAPSRLADRVRRERPIEHEVPREEPTLAIWMRALRLHQWLKNLLLFVPLLTAFSFLEMGSVVAMVTAFFAFSLAASGTYLLNDLWDLDNDRAHPRKRQRPFASAIIPIIDGIAISMGLLVSGILLAASVSPAFLVMLLLYLFLTMSYSLFLKKYVLIDVVMLSLLYTLRIVAGAVAISVTVSSWLLAFSVFIFLSLALVKRCAELVMLRQNGGETITGRDYRVTDLVVLWPFGVGSAVAAVVVFSLFINSPDTQLRYQSPQLLWLVAVGLIYWLIRLWIKTVRGEMHDDPVIYAIKDPGSRAMILVLTSIMLLAYFISLGRLL